VETWSLETRFSVATGPVTASMVTAISVRTSVRTRSLRTSGADRNRLWNTETAVGYCLEIMRRRALSARRSPYESSVNLRSFGVWK
jgi:hypothetical protein